MNFAVPFVWFISSAALAATPPVSLVEAYQAAVTKTETVQIAETGAERADYQLDQVQGALFPSISFIGSYTRQHDPSTAASGALSNAFTPNQTNARFNLTQPLFRGLAEYAAIRQAKAQKRASEASREAAKISVFSNVTELYYAHLSADRDVKNLTALADLTEKRVREVRERVKIGRSRRGDLLAAEAQLASLQANLASSVATAKQARETLALATGLPEDTTFSDDVSEPQAPADLPSLVKSLEARPDILAGKESWQASDEQVAVAWGGHLPSVDLSGNYYLKRMGIIGEVKWDVGISITVPIFQGGAVQAQVRDAAALRKQSELTLARTRRAAETEVRSLHAQLAGLLAQHAAFKAALTAAEENFREQNKDYKYGLVTNLDVLQALNTLQETKRSADRVRYEARTASLQLGAAVGRLPEK